MSAVILIRWITFGVFAALFIVVAVTNIALLIRYFLKSKHSSLIPFVGGLAGAVSCFTCPYRSVGVFWWLPLLLDVGALPLIVPSFIWYLFRLLRRKDGY